MISVNADDYGWNERNSTAIVEAFNHGIIDTTTMMVNTEYFSEAVELAKENMFSYAVGIHLNLSAGKPVTEEIKSDPTFCDPDGNFHGNIWRIKLSRHQKCEVEEELKAQLNKFLSANLQIHHIDSHRHIHISPDIFPIVIRLAREYQVKKVRIASNCTNMTIKRKAYVWLLNTYLKITRMNYTDYFGSIDDVREKILKAIDKDIEIMTHPDYSISNDLIDRNNSLSSRPTGDSLYTKLSNEVILNRNSNILNNSK